MVVLSVRGPSLFPLFFRFRNFEFPAKIKKRGGKTHRTPYCGGGAQRDGGSAVAAAWWLRRWWQRDIVTIPVIALSSHLNDSTSHTAFLYSVASIDAEGRTFNDGN